MHNPEFRRRGLQAAANRRTAAAKALGVTQVEPSPAAIAAASAKDLAGDQAELLPAAIAAAAAEDPRGTCAEPSPATAAAAVKRGLFHDASDASAAPVGS